MTPGSGPDAARLNARGGSFGHVPELDGVRGLAVVLVLVGHLFNGFMPEAAGLGVSLFFALSGYLITSILMSERERSGSNNLKHFYLRRARRLLPPLVLFLAVFAIWAWTQGWTNSRIAHSTLPVLFYSANWAGAIGWGVGQHMAHTWSLAVEEQFYIVWPLLFAAIVGRKAWCWALFFAVGVILSRYAAVYLLGLPSDPIYTLLRYDEIFLGCALALARRQFPSSVGLVALAVLLLLSATPGARALADNLGYVLISITCVLLVGASTRMSWLFSTGVLRYMGRISYSVYLWHFPIWEITANPYLTLLLSIGIADLSWRFVESPIMRGKYLPWLSPERHARSSTSAPDPSPVAPTK